MPKSNKFQNSSQRIRPSVKAGLTADGKPSMRIAGNKRQVTAVLDALAAKYGEDATMASIIDDMSRQ
jgi:hypothetical protein